MKLKVEELNSSVQKLGEMIKDIKIAMLTTSNSEGKVHSRPMMTQEIEFDGDLWFFTSISSGKMFELESSQEVNVAYSSPEHSRYVSVSGQAEVVRDRAKAEELWNPLYKTWFKQGLEDPDLVLLKVKVDSAEYWDSAGGPVGTLLRFAKGMLTGDMGKVGENKKIEIHH